MGTLESSLLDFLNDGVVTDDIGQSSLLHGVHKLLQIIEVGVAVSEEKPVIVNQSVLSSQPCRQCYSPISILQVMELQTYQAGEGRAEQSIPIDGVLSDSSGIEIDIVNIAIEGAESQPHLRTHLNGPLSPGCDWL